MPKKKLPNYEKEILTFIREHHSGVTLADISKKMKFSKNTISKYVMALELKDKVYSQPVGRYKLYFSTSKSFLPKATIISIIKALFLAIKTKFPNQPQLYKEIGVELQKNFDYRYSKGFFNNGVNKKEAVNEITDFKPHFEYFIDVFNSQNIFQDTINVELIRYENNEKKAIYKFSNSEFLETNDNFIFYFYMIAGIIEVYLGEELERKVNCEIINTNISEKKDESYVEMFIEIE